MDVRPLPRPNALTAPYWEACRRGELTVQRCRHCGRRAHLSEAACPHCGGTDLPLVFLASDEAGYCTGSEVLIDGGMLTGAGY